MTAALHRFVGWLVEQEVIERAPIFRWPRRQERLPAVLSLETQQRILEAISEPARGAFLAMARLGLRPSEAVVLQRGDLRDGWLHVTRARKDRGLDAPAWGTKTGRAKVLPVPEDLGAWIEAHSPRGPGALLFPNPRTGGAWSEAALRRQWGKARRAVGLGPEVGLYVGTKHSTATALRRAGVPLDVLQRLLGHADRRSTELYAQLADGALVEALRKK